MVKMLTQKKALVNRGEEILFLGMERVYDRAVFRVFLSWRIEGV